MVQKSIVNDAGNENFPFFINNGFTDKELHKKGKLRREKNIPHFYSDFRRLSCDAVIYGEKKLR